MIRFSSINKIEMESLTLKISRRSSSKSQNFKHYNVNELPNLVFYLDKQADEMDMPKVFGWNEKFWKIRDENRLSRQQRYEEMLASAVSNAIRDTNEAWQKIYEEDFNKKLSEFLKPKAN